MQNASDNEHHMKLNDFGFSVNKKEGKGSWLVEKRNKRRARCHSLLHSINEDSHYKQTEQTDGTVCQTRSLIWISMENNHPTPRYRLPSTAHCSWLRSYNVTADTHTHTHTHKVASNNIYCNARLLTDPPVSGGNEVTQE